MRVFQFSDYRQYLDIQRRGSAYRPHRASGVGWRQVKVIFRYLQDKGIPVPARIICHGARDGNEVRLFRAFFPEAEVLGTDVAPYSPDVLEWDFQQERSDWTAAFDVLYSNSLDHSSSPAACAATWMGQLKPGGLAFVHWTRSHILDDLTDKRTLPGGDCFGASLHEYIELFENAGRVRDLIYEGRKRRVGMRVLIVVGPKGKR